MPEQEISAAPHRQEEGRHRTLLLVDDEENILSSLKRLLRRDGYRILTANSGQAGLDILAGETVDVIVSDQRMPHMTGVEFLRHAKERWPDTIRMVLSGYTDLQSITDAINEGSIYKFLTKPWDDEHLRANIEEAFRRKDMMDENRHLHEVVGETNTELAAANARLQQLLAEKQERIRIDEASLGVSQEIFQHLPWPVLGIDVAGLVSVANQAAMNMFRDKPALIGCFITDILPPAWYAAVESADDGEMLVEADGRGYQLIWRHMGATSQSRGRLLVISLCGSCTAYRQSNLLHPESGDGGSA